MAFDPGIIIVRIEPCYRQRSQMSQNYKLKHVEHACMIYSSVGYQGRTINNTLNRAIKL